MKHYYFESFESAWKCKRIEIKNYIWLLCQELKAFRDESLRDRYRVRRKQLIKNMGSTDYPADLLPPKKKVAVYTCIFGNYDSIKPVLAKSKYCDYWIITDQDVEESSGWKKLPVSFPEDVKNGSPVLKNRYCKMHPHVLFPDCDYSIYIDGSICIYGDIFPLLGRLGNRFMGMYAHSGRSCIYQEAEKVVELGKASREMTERLMARYRSEGYPENFGMTDGITIVRKHGDKNCIKVMQTWWSVFFEYPERDQLGLGYALWKNRFTFSDVACLGLNYQEEARLTSKGHRISKGSSV